MPASLTYSATIANGASLSGAIDVGIVSYGPEIVGIVMPAAFTGTTLSFQVSADDGTYQDLYGDDGSEVTITVAAARTVTLKQDTRSKLSRWRYLKVRSGTSASPTTEGAARTVQLWIL